jgi:DNA-binding transcriptional LysR family regulator
MSKFECMMTLIDVVEQNGFAAAAKKQKISPAAISRQIARLEKELGVQLLTRTTRQTALTEIGQQYYQHCKNVFNEIAVADALVTGSQREPMGILKITSSRYFVEEYILPRLPKFMSLYPRLRLNLELAERFPNLTQENIDILFGVSMEGPDDLVRKAVTTTRYVICAAPAYLKKYGIPETPSDLINHRYITHSMRKPANTISFKDGKEVNIDPILSLNDSRIMRECALQGMGIVKLHDYMVQNALKEKRLIEILSDYAEPKIMVYLYYQSSRYLQPKIRKFIDYFTAPK